MNKTINLRDWVESLLLVNPWKLYKNRLLPQYFVDIYNQLADKADVLKDAKRVYRREIVTAILWYPLGISIVSAFAAMIAMIFIKEARLPATEFILVVAVSVAMLSVKVMAGLDKSVKLARKTVKDFQEKIYELARHMDMKVLQWGFPNEEGRVALRNLDGAVVKHALDDRQYKLALNLRRAEIVRDEGLIKPPIAYQRIFNAGESSADCAARYRSLLQAASEAMRVFSLGWPWKALFIRANQEIHSENEQAWRSAPGWII